MHVEHELLIDVTPEALWGLTVDVERWPTMFSTVTTVERLEEGPVSVGSTALIRQPWQLPRVWTVTQVDAPRRFVWTAPIGKAQMTACHELTPAGTGSCLNRLSIDIEGPGSRILGLLLGGKMSKVLAAENRGFAAACNMSDISDGAMPHMKHAKS
ncbi:MAG: SRPBCC family protein [Microthrixaceae bacterium]|nr:SRPBCC family protein [Microthrixaceae bacterium]